MAKDFSQEAGLDYSETFSPVVKPSIVRLVLALSATFGWQLQQLDVKNAFLHGILHEEVYMSQPLGFIDSENPNLVCKLHKSLYGLKQAPRAWNDRFTQFLPSLGFKASHADPSLFVLKEADSLVFLLLYVDDIIITGSHSTVIQMVIDQLSKEFDMKHLGALHYFLGLQIQYPSNGIFIHQSKYIHHVLMKANLLDCKPCVMPYHPNHKLLKDDNFPYSDPAHFHSIVGALQYLTFTRPNIAYVVHQVCQFMHSPLDTHYLAVKRILRYLKGTIGHGLLYKKGSLDLTAYTDANWACDPNYCRSTTDFVVFLGSNPVSWSSKKQQSVYRSSTEVEYRVMAVTAAEVVWLH
ncbi:uncharacterized protein LOC110754690 [Prunus avium]|uniref:Uncharacterized protein LOC110754690 n=1 Tax=Prunus avium TaxID=42229 RepID=A0A6P5S6Y6_PRUAV|nr:uncharacterized protein LOC110754690 [Prunus avium]